MRTALGGAVAALLVGGGAAWAQSVETIWQNNCISCHGEKGQGGSAPSLLDDEWRFGGTLREIFNSVKDGHPDAGMEPFGAVLSDAQVWGVVNYLHELRARDRRGRGIEPKAEGGVYRGKHGAYRVEVVVESGLETPWAVDWLPSGEMLVTTRPGELFVAKRSANGARYELGKALSGLPKVRSQGQGGLMDVAVHPRYAENGWVYLGYSDPIERGRGSVGMTKIVRGKIKDGAWTEQETIFAAKPEHYVPTDIHFGTRIVFEEAAGGKYFVYFGIGERGLMDMAQDLTRPNGKIHRVWDDGKIPEDNPFAGAGMPAGTYASIWSFGHRNPQGLTRDLAGNLWETEHGPRGGDELNRIVKGRNYGWPVVSFGVNYNGSPFRVPFPDLMKRGAAEGSAARALSGAEALSAGGLDGAGKVIGGITGTSAGGEIVMPALVWLPSIAACGLDVVRGKAFPGWEGDLVAGGLAGETVERVRMKDGVMAEREELVHGLGRVRDVVVSPAGEVYIVLNGRDRIVRLTPAE